MENLKKYLKQQEVDFDLEDTSIYKLKHDNFNFYEGIEDELNSMKGGGHKYKDIEEILIKYSENPYSKRRLIYYMEKDILPEVNKTSQNQAEYNDYHLGMFFLIDQMQEVYKIEEISVLVHKLLKVSKYLDFGKLLTYYASILHGNNILNNDINRMRNIIIGESTSSAGDNCKEQVDKMNSIIESSQKRMQGMEEESKKATTKEIIEIILSIKYLAYSKYYLSMFEKFAK